MTHLIFALGNPGPIYNFTRHNFGFLALDFYAKTHSLSFTPSKKWNASTAKIGNDTLLIKPTTFYNEVGLPISQIIRFYKPSLKDILVICDDFSLPFGQIRHRPSGSAGGNNGLKSIIEHLGTDQFPRLRLGTDSPARATLGDTDFVLSRFTDDEKSQLPTILTQTSAAINKFYLS